MKRPPHRYDRLDPRLDKRPAVYDPRYAALPNEPHLRIVSGPANGPVASNRQRLGIEHKNHTLIKEAVAREKLMNRRDYSNAIDDSYDPLSWERINA